MLSTTNAHKVHLAQREQHINKQQSRWMLPGKIPRVCICLFVSPKITSPSISQSQVKLYPSPAEEVGYHCICPGCTNVLFSCIPTESVVIFIDMLL